MQGPVASVAVIASSSGNGCHFSSRGLITIKSGNIDFSLANKLSSGAIGSRPRPRILRHERSRMNVDSLMRRHAANKLPQAPMYRSTMLDSLPANGWESSTAIAKPIAVNSDFICQHAGQ